MKEEELKSYDPRVHVFWQKNGWMDKEVALQWVEKTFPLLLTSHMRMYYFWTISVVNAQKNLP